MEWFYAKHGAEEVQVRTLLAPPRQPVSDRWLTMLLLRPGRSSTTLCGSPFLSPTSRMPWMQRSTCAARCSPRCLTTTWRCSRFHGPWTCSLRCSPASKRSHRFPVTEVCTVPLPLQPPLSPPQPFLPPPLCGAKMAFSRRDLCARSAWVLAVCLFVVVVFLPSFLPSFLPFFLFLVLQAPLRSVLVPSREQTGSIGPLSTVASAPRFFQTWGFDPPEWKTTTTLFPCSTRSRRS